MSHYNALTDSERIRLARDAVKCHVPIAPFIENWLKEENLYDQIMNPRKTNEITANRESGQNTS